MAIKNFSLRIDEQLLDKLHAMADYEGRSANGQVVYLIRKAVEQHESKNGKLFIEHSEQTEPQK